MIISVVVVFFFMSELSIDSLALSHFALLLLPLMMMTTTKMEGKAVVAMRLAVGREIAAGDWE
jgi:hypothetical protein